jgi:uncharacterized membrane protein YgcG
MTSPFRAIVLLLLLVAPAAGQTIDLAPPGQRDFVRDLADMIDKQDEATIIKIADQLLTDTGTPIIVITMESMAHYGGPNMSIETFSHLLFDQWGVGQATINGQQWNTGILLLVARDDRKARIQLGFGWRHDYNRHTRQIMSNKIIANFKRRAFSQGIREAVVALDAMARGKFDQLPSSHVASSRDAPVRDTIAAAPINQHSSPGLASFIAIAFIIILIVVIVTIARSGQHVIGRATRRSTSVLGTFMDHANRRSRRGSRTSSSDLFQLGKWARGSSSHTSGGSSAGSSPSSGGGFFSGGGSASWGGSVGGGSFGGGSFGGGFSGGGGASGSW